MCYYSGKEGECQHFFSKNEGRKKRQGNPPGGLDFPAVFLYSNEVLKFRGIAQLVEQRSPKPRAEGSNPSAPAIKVFTTAVVCDIVI